MKDKKLLQSKKAKTFLIGIAADIVVAMLVQYELMDKETAYGLMGAITLKVFGHNYTQSKQDVANAQASAPKEDEEDTDFDLPTGQ